MKAQLFLTMLVVILAAAFYAFDDLGQPVQAAAPNGCTSVGTIGAVEVALCEDEDTGLMVWGNSAGMMVPAQQ